jgi:hypothetical protein
MSVGDVIERFRRMAAEIQGHPEIEVLACEFNPPATEEELAEIEKNFKLTPAMLDFYRGANGLSISWERRGKKETESGGLAVGHIHLLPVQEVFGSWEGVIYFEAGSRFGSLHPFDFFIEEACAALKLYGPDNPPVFYHSLGGEMSPLGVDFAGYLELLLQSRGFWYWHLAIATHEYSSSDAPMTDEEKNFRETMPQLFPDFDETLFKRVANPANTGQTPES